ncbi:hypothetical protein [Dyella psychrodurans]|uniref:hypothetical protein n=1 Tax=Dyella psychrodurans TaxID=1927960 RepID=UPI0013140C5F|nr:hypothetical protein [Dyella psychrodurans]
MIFGYSLVRRLWFHPGDTIDPEARKNGEVAPSIQDTGPRKASQAYREVMSRLYAD